MTSNRAGPRPVWCPWTNGSNCTPGKRGGSGILKVFDAGLRPTLRDAATLMIVLSYNTATNLVIDVRRLGESSPSDMCALVRGIANKRTLMAPDVCEAVEDVLAAQQYLDQVPRYLRVSPYAAELGRPGAPVTVVNKTGFFSGTRANAGIVRFHGGEGFKGARRHRLSGSPRRRPFSRGVIVAVEEPGRLPTGEHQSIEARGLILAPGFIDVHSHADNAPFLDEDDTSKILQGVTTEVVGNCGFTLAPRLAATGPDLEALASRMRATSSTDDRWRGPATVASSRSRPSCGCCCRRSSRSA
jgi:hypothetical protein